jgi:hypothetical protein
MGNSSGVTLRGIPFLSGIKLDSYKHGLTTGFCCVQWAQFDHRANPTPDTTAFEPLPDSIMMKTTTIDALFTSETLHQLFPKERSNEFFDALFGDADEGAYDIELAYGGSDGKSITLELRLHERPGRCLVCSLTQGLPEVFTRHPVIDVAGLVREIDTLLAGAARCGEWSLGRTEQRKKNLHIIPLTIQLKS